MKQVVLVQYLLSLALLCAASQANHPLLVRDADMGIHTYDSVVNIGAQLLDIRIQLRFLCNKQQDSSSGSGSPQDTAVTSSSSSWANEVTIEGFVSAFPVNDKPPPWSPIAPHYVPPNVRQQLNISIISRCAWQFGFCAGHGSWGATALSTVFPASTASAHGYLSS